MNKFLIVAAIAGIIAICFGISDEQHRAAKWVEKLLMELTPARTVTSSSTAADSSFDLRMLAKRARNAVVSIEVFDDEGNSIGTGSGFFVSDDGLLVTNYHVIERASSASAKTASGDRLSIKGVVYFDRDNDLAVLLAEGKTFPPLPLGNSSKIEVGDHVAVIGSPLGLEGSLSEGIISGKRDFTDLRRQPTPGVSVEPYPPPRNFDLPFDKPDWLQITAAISPGSSGSPVLDATGNVIGIATMVLRGGQSLNFAVPAEVVVAMLKTHKGQHGEQRPLVTFKDLLRQEAQIQEAASSQTPRRSQATVDKDSLLGRPDHFFWLGSVENFLGVLDFEATRATPPYHLRKCEDWKDGTKTVGKKVVFERSDRVVEFLVGPVPRSRCEVTFVQTCAYRPAVYEAVERWEKNPDPNTPDFPTIP